MGERGGLPQRKKPQQNIARTAPTLLQRNAHPMHTHHQRAFSLIELLITLTLLALLASIALPNFSGWVERNRIETLRNLLQTQINHARASSVLHNRDVVVCGSSDGQNCDNRWDMGWLLHYFGTEKLLSQHRLTAQDQLQWKGFNKKIRFHSNGTAPGGNGRFYFCNNQNEVILQMVLNRQGRLRRVSGLEPDQQVNIGCE
ncbi:MAG: GspH/FimT family protein [Pseudomonas sp.]